LKKALRIALTLLASVAFVTAVFAQSPAGKPAAAASRKSPTSAPGKKPIVERKRKAAKGKTYQYTGDVTKVDDTAKTIAVKGKKDEEMTFDVGMARRKGKVEEGEKVTVKYTKKEGRMIASAVTNVSDKKEMRKEMQPGAKPIHAPAKK
jgi:hypothetical protein